MSRARIAALAALASSLLAAGPARAAELRIAIVQAQAGDARKYQPLLDYLGKKGVQAQFVTAPDYVAAAEMFSRGAVDAMFGGSGIAGTMMIKELADPVVRAIGADGVGTYSAIVVAPRGTPKFDGKGSWFDGKRVIFSSLASAGEFYFRALGPSKPAATLKAASHGAALDALGRGQADVAIVKNHVWTREQSKFPGLEAVGGDSGENPDGSLVISRKLAAAQAQQVTAALVGLEKDAGAEAKAARESLKIRGYVAATARDFAHTLDLLKKAGVTKAFAFKF